MVRRAGEGRSANEGTCRVYVLTRPSGYAEEVEIDTGTTFGRLMELEGVDITGRALSVNRGGETLPAVLASTVLEGGDIVNALPEKITGA